MTPTYLVTYPVATDDRAVALLKAIHDTQKCEIGAHCHPWNTPPLIEENSAAYSMLCNLPADLQYEKMKHLDEAIQRRLGVKPVSFRSGRFGYSTDVARNLDRLGYQVETSITPYVDWTREHGPDFTASTPRAFRFSSDDAFRESADGKLTQVPATVGFLQRDFARSSAILRTVTRAPLRRLKLAGMLHHLRLVNKVWLSPEQSSSAAMIALARNMIANGYRVLNMMFHSPSLKAGLTPFTRTTGDEKQLFLRLQEFLVFARDTGIESMKLADVRHLDPWALTAS
ncbi:MAG: hypothetical protein DME04_06410 [Candidatus Rokuibacteriota bacterium]|nr:MAG: hypothetical protein DME04_06410 [Candidatus Rokubacteria bacterium]